MRLDYREGLILVIGTIVAHYIDNVLNIFDPLLKKIITLSIIDIILISIGLIGSFIIIYDWFRRFNERKQQVKIHSKKETSKKPLRYFPKAKTSDDKLYDLIHEIDFFTNLWYQWSLFNKGYRQQINNTIIDKNRGKIRESEAHNNHKISYRKRPESRVLQ